MKLTNLLGIAICLAGLSACGEDPEKTTPESTCKSDQTYKAVAEPFLKKNCLTCHATATAEKVGGGHDFSGEDEVREHGHVMFEYVTDGMMPPEPLPKLTAAEKKPFLDWLECSGASEAGEGHDH